MGFLIGTKPGPSKPTATFHYSLINSRVHLSHNVMSLVQARAINSRVHLSHNVMSLVPSIAEMHVIQGSSSAKPGPSIAEFTYPTM